MRSIDSRAPAGLWSSGSGHALPSAETPLRMTSIGWAVAGSASSTSSTAGGRHAQPAQLLLVRVQLVARRQLAVDQQVRDFLELAVGGEVEDVVAAVAEAVARRGRRSKRAVSPATTPDRATDFFGLNAGSSPSRPPVSSGRVRLLPGEQLVELALVRVIVQHVVQLLARLHRRDERLPASRRAGASRTPPRPPCSSRGTRSAGTAPAARPPRRAASTRNSGVLPNSVTFASTGTPTAHVNRRYSSSVVSASAKIMSAPASTYARRGRSRRRAPRRRGRPCAPSTTNASSARASTAALIRSHISAALTSRLARAVPAALRLHLVLDVTPRGPGAAQLADRAGDHERPAPARVGVDEQRQRRGLRDPPGVLADVVERRHAEVGQAERRVRHARPGKVERRNPARSASSAQ